MSIIPPLVLWIAGALGAAALAKFLAREYRRVNEELEAARAKPVAEKAERAGHPTLRRDPQTGIYRPQ